jgi:hypothetical protein
MLLGKASLFCTVALMAGCAADAEDGAVEEPSAEELRSLSIRLEGSGSSLAVMDSPKLKARARGTLACATRFDVDGRSRLECKRGDEKLEVLVRKSEGKAVLLHRGDGRARRIGYTCTTTGSGPDGLPEKLACRLKETDDEGGGEGEGAGGLSSPFKSTVEGIDIPNTHLVGDSGKLLRGMAPRTPAEMNQLFQANVGAVLVFKNQTGNGSDVADEISALVAGGIAQSRAVNIPFKWKDLGGFQEPCSQTIEALKFIKSNLAAGKKTFFHCTVGEDRTGTLAALHRLITEPNLKADQAWDAEMCERGYGAGNPNKPAFVLGKLEDGLKPLYRKLAYLIAKGQITSANLDASVCATDPEGAADFATASLPLNRLKCGTSTMFEP